MLTPEQLDALRVKAEAATPGPWAGGRHDMFSILDGYKSKYIYAGRDIVAVSPGWDKKGEAQVIADAVFIAAANPATVLRLLDVINTLAIWLSYSNDCPMPDCHPCEYRSGSGCDADINKMKACWIQAAEEVTNDDPRTN